MEKNTEVKKGKKSNLLVALYVFIIVFVVIGVAVAGLCVYTKQVNGVSFIEQIIRLQNYRGIIKPKFLLGENDKIVLTELKVDNEKLFVKYDFITQSELSDKADAWDVAKLEVGNNIYALNDKSSYEIVNLGNNKYEVYCFYDVSGLDFEEGIQFVSDLMIIDASDLQYQMYGYWTIEFDVNKKLKTSSDEIYNLENIRIEEEDSQDDYEAYGVDILEARKLENNVTLLALVQGYTTEEGCYSQIDVLDENGNSLMLNGKSYIPGGVTTDLFLKKFDLDSDIKIRLEEVTSDGSVIRSAESVVNLENYIKEKAEDTSKKLETYTWGDMEFSYDSTKWEISYVNDYGSASIVNPDEFLYSVSMLRNDNIDNRNIEHITIMKYDNEFNQTLDEVVETVKKLFDLGILSNIEPNYVIYESEDENSDAKEYVFSHQEIMDIYDGKNVTVNGKEFTKENMSEEVITTGNEYKNKEKVNINGIDGYSYIYDNGDTSKTYIFLNGNDIYEIIVPLNLKIDEEVEEFINSIKFN